MHDHGAEQLAARRDAEILGKRADGADALERYDLGPMHVAAVANLLGDAADLERVGARVPIRDEAAHSGDAHQDALVAQFPQRAIRRHARYTE